MEADTEKLRQETAARFNELNRREKQLKEELEKLQGRKQGLSEISGGRQESI